MIKKFFDNRIFQAKSQYKELMKALCFCIIKLAKVPGKLQ